MCSSCLPSGSGSVCPSPGFPGTCDRQCLVRVTVAHKADGTGQAQVTDKDLLVSVENLTQCKDMQQTIAS